jgi:hypothetical protein
MLLAEKQDILLFGLGEEVNKQSELPFYSRY